jgi:CrcB protein
MTYLFIALGGALGAVLRYIIASAVAFPFGTLTVNVLGSFIMGLAFVWFSTKTAGQWPLFVMTGLLGGFTTFSAFSLDVLKLYEAEKYMNAGGYIVASVVFSLLAVFAGVYVMKAVYA